MPEAASKRSLRLFGRATVRGVDGNVVELDAVETRQRLAIRVIADDQGNYAGEFSSLVAVQKIRQTVQILRHENRHPRRLRPQVEAPAHLQCGGQVLKLLAKRKQVERRQIPFPPHKEELGLGVLMLIGARDVGAVPVK